MTDLSTMASVSPRSARLKELALVLRQYTKNMGRNKCSSTAIDGLAIFSSEHAMLAGCHVFKPAIFITIQSTEWSIGHENPPDYRIGGGYVVSIGVSCGGTVPDPNSKLPYVRLVIELERAFTRGVVEELGIPMRPTSKHRDSGFLLLDPSPQLLDCALRSVRLLDTPEAIPMLYCGVMREICYWLLNSPARDQILDITMANVHDGRVLQAMKHLRGKFSSQIRVDDLADAAGMSNATFHRQFKSVTSMSPMQYRKQLRLLEARRLMITSNVNIETVASRVGYVSASQFSREYARMFGKPPRRDTSTCGSLQTTAV